MNLEQYVKDAVRTESRIDKINLKDPKIFLYALRTYIAAGNVLDCYKKNVFYGKDTDEEVLHWLRAIDRYGFQLDDMESEQSINPRLFHAMIGIATEASEIMEALLEVVFMENDLDEVNLAEELGDLDWYQAIALDAMNVKFETVLNTNIEKLRKRFPEKYTDENAIERDLNEERNTLETGLTRLPKRSGDS